MNANLNNCKMSVRVDYLGIAATDFFGFNDAIWFSEDGSMAFVEGHDLDAPIFTALSRAYNARLGYGEGEVVSGDLKAWPAGERWPA